MIDEYSVENLIWVLQTNVEFLMDLNREASYNQILRSDAIIMECFRYLGSREDLSDEYIKVLQGIQSRLIEFNKENKDLI